MKRLGVAVVVVLAAGAGVGSFLATRSAGFGDIATAPAASRPRPATPLAKYLNLSGPQARAVRQADPDFPAEAERLDAALKDERRRLAELLEATPLQDDAVLAQLEKVIASHNALERRATEHILAIRPHLSTDQQKRLMRLVARSVRSAGATAPAAAARGRDAQHRAR